MELDAPLAPIIARVPAWRAARQIQAERIAGLTNANYRVVVEGEPYALRVSGPNTARLGINRTHEAAAWQAASAAGLAPELIAYLPPEGHLVTRWVAGHHWSASEFRTPDNVRRLTRVVQHIHTLPPNGAEFSPFQRVEAFLATALEFGVPLPPEIDASRQAMRAIQADQQRDSSRWQRFCHNDLASVNYLVSVGASEPVITVLDWEFAGLGDSYYDLATVVYTHDSDGPLPPELQEVMLETYFGVVTPWHRRRLLGMQAMLTLFTGAWALAQHGMQQAGLVPPPEGFDYLALAEYFFAHDIPALQAQYRQSAAST